MKYISVLALIWSGIIWGQPQSSWTTPFEASDSLETATYAQAIAWYEALSDSFPEATLTVMGPTDAGPPLHLFEIAPADSAAPTLLINNAIHAGEPCGVDASMLLARDLLTDPRLGNLREKVRICIIPVYSVGGVLNRGPYSRTNQVGPEAYGFRANARNYDLNRDFIKADTRNARSFAEIFHRVKPDLFVDHHTTNGADYPAVLTIIPTEADKATPALATYTTETLLPRIYNHMQEVSLPVCPYVYSLGRSPDAKGIMDFLDLPRYSSGYAALFGCASFISEAHMLKTFAQRVKATYHFDIALLEAAADPVQGPALLQAVKADREWLANQEAFDLAWTLDTSRVDSLLFAGYEARTKPSAITGKDRMYYDREAPYQRNIPFYQHYQATASADRPTAYVVPQGQAATIERLQAQGVPMQRFKRDTSLRVEAYYLEDVKTSKGSYEGHFYHQSLKTRTEPARVLLLAGDWIVWPEGYTSAYTVHALEPLAQDAFFRWNFYDSFLMRKEYFSSYIFEDEAAEMLAKDPELAADFAAAKARDEQLRNSAYMQLNYLYERSPHAEPTYLRYPIFRWQGKATQLRHILE
ncbi:MAG: M14 family zinc carboxypeptidase [Bacteroidota bacterium]